MSITLSMLLGARLEDVQRLAAWLGLDTSGPHLALARRVHTRIRPERVRGMYR